MSALITYGGHHSNFHRAYGTVREFANKSAASPASPHYVKFQAVVKSAASAASLRGGRAGSRLDHGFFLNLWLRWGQKMIKISDSDLSWPFVASSRLGSVLYLFKELGLPRGTFWAGTIVKAKAMVAIPFTESKILTIFGR